MSFVAIIDTGVANLASMRRAFASLGVEPVVTSEAGVVAAAPFAVLPGVGSFASGMAALHRAGLEDAVRGRIARDEPTLAVCLGLQLLCEGSDENPDVPGLGVIAGRCARLGPGVPVPQLGWNVVSPEDDLRWIRPGYAAFANSYGLLAAPAGWRIATGYYGAAFVAAAERGRTLACQFHPELSGPWGRALLERWLRDAPAARQRPVLRDTTPSTQLQHQAISHQPRSPRRLLPCLDVRDGRVVKGVRFQALRDMGDPAAHAARYAAEGADEVVVLDVSASPEGRATALETVRRVRAALDIPLTAGGGVRSPDDAARLLDAGADKVSVNTAAVAAPGLLDALSERFGAQCTVLAIDARRRMGPDDGLASEPACWDVLVSGGRTRTGRDAIAWMAEGARRGAGEILLTSWDRDGTRSGCDLALLRAARATVSVPIIASGGVGSIDDAADAFAAGADAVLAASLFHEDRLDIAHVKRALAARGIAVRS